MDRDEEGYVPEANLRTGASLVEVREQLDKSEHL
jgi:hypothetical protein